MEARVGSMWKEWRGRKRVENVKRILEEGWMRKLDRKRNGQEEGAAETDEHGSEGWWKESEEDGED